jgi:hypothetical protein
MGLLVVALGYGGFGVWEGTTEPTPEQLAARKKALAGAKVFVRDSFDARAIDFARDPNRDLIDPELTICKFEPSEIKGTSPKFDCTLESGETVKVKYGRTKEIPSEIVTTRLLDAIGFAADGVSPVKTVRCLGCPFQPFHTRSLTEMLRVDTNFDERVDYEKSRDFRGVSVERKIDGKAVKAGDQEGWAFYELDAIDPKQGGATRAEVDALRLMAVFLHHWDNKPQNQRLVCVGADSADCAHPVAMIQDAGSEFGPKKVEVDQWRDIPIWADVPSCTLSMKRLPYRGGTFDDVRISEAGRRLLADRLKQLSAQQIATLFTVARLNGELAEWIVTFEDKVRQIADREPCPE